jgi:acyl dehydratase
VSGLLTDRIREMVGREVAYTAPEPLGRAAIRYFARATGDDAPEHLAGDVAPPTLVFETNQYADLPRDADGYAGHTWGLDVPGARAVRGGHDYRWHRPLRPDDVVTATWVLLDVDERETRSGAPMLVVTSRCRYTDAAGGPIAEQVETILHIGPEP